jgi:hypothetical protein
MRIQPEITQSARYNNSNNSTHRPSRTGVSPPRGLQPPSSRRATTRNGGTVASSTRQMCASHLYRGLCMPSLYADCVWRGKPSGNILYVCCCAARHPFMHNHDTITGLWLRSGTAHRWDDALQATLAAPRLPYAPHPVTHHHGTAGTPARHPCACSVPLPSAHLGNPP